MKVSHEWKNNMSILRPGDIEDEDNVTSLNALEREDLHIMWLLS